MIEFEFSLIDWSIPIIVAIFSFIVGKRFRANSLESYLVAERSVSALALAASLTAGVYGGGFLLAVSGLVSEFGSAAIWIVVGLALGSFTAMFVLVPHKNRMDKLNVSTLAEFFGENWGTTAQRMVSIMVLLWAGSLLVMQLIAAGQLSSMATGINPTVGIVASVAIVMSYCVRGGLKSVIFTDLVQLVIVVAVAFVAFGGVHLKTGLIPLVSVKETPTTSSSLVIGLVAMGTMNMIAGADLWQRMFASKSQKAARIGFFLGAIFILVIGSVLVIIALAGQSDKPELPSTYLMIWGMFRFVPQWMYGFVLAFLLVLVLSTLDTMACIVSVSTTKDFRVMLPDAKKYRNAKLSTALVLIGASIFAIFFDNIVSWAVGFSYLGLALGPCVLASRGRMKLSILSANLSIGLGLAIAGFLVFTGEVEPDSASFVLMGSILGAIIGTIVDYFLKKRKTFESQYSEKQ